MSISGQSSDIDSPQPPRHVWFDNRHVETYPRQYLEGIVHFNEGRYFDAHESWEEIWLPATGDEKLFLQMLIQSAVGLHHYKQSNHRGALNMHRAVVDKLSRLPDQFMSLDLSRFREAYQSFLRALVEAGVEGAEANPVQSAFATDRRPMIVLLRLG